MIDLYCGAGGMTLGFAMCPEIAYVPILAVDNNPNCIATYNANFGDHGICIDLQAALDAGDLEVPSADLVVGGPPCQGFSLLNKRRRGDSRRDLWRPFMDVVECSGASVFVIENVAHLLGSEEHADIVAHARKLGFAATSVKLIAADFGVPQTRVRAIILGVKGELPEGLFPPLKTHINPALADRERRQRLLPQHLGEYAPAAKPWRTVRDAIGDLPEPVGTEVRREAPPLNLHFGRNPTEKSLERYRAVPNEGENRFDLLRRRPDLTPDCWVRKTKGGTDLFGRLWWDRPAFTIRTEFYKPEKGRYLHPVEHRPITHREAARLQSFPDSFIFCGTKIEIAKQIGNAVPPLLAKSIASSIGSLICPDA